MTLKNSPERPLVTFALFAYNQESYIREAVEGALTQDYGNLQIILSDDCSSDNTFRIIKSIADNYQGDHSIVINRNLENQGLSMHFNKIMEIAKGDIIVVAAGDDISLPDRVSRTVKAFTENPKAMLVSFSDHLINSEGVIIRSNPCCDYGIFDVVSLVDFLSGKKVQLSGASRGFRRELYRTFGALTNDCPTEDTPYLLRGLMMGDAYVYKTAGIFYRKHESSLSGARSINSMNFEAIAGQYRRDVMTAKAQGLITPTLAEKFDSWIARNQRRRYIQKAVFEKRLSFLGWIIKVFLRSDHTIREKLGLVKRVFRNGS